MRFTVRIPSSVWRGEKQARRQGDLFGEQCNISQVRNDGAYVRAAAARMRSEADNTAWWRVEDAGQGA